MAAPKIVYREIEALTPDPSNARTHSAEQIALIAGSIQRFGWTYPVLADDTIRAGHGRVEAAKLIYEGGGRIFMAPGEEAGGAAVPRGKVPVIDCTGWSDEARRAYALADNQLALQAGWDGDALAREIEALTAGGVDVADLGFDTATLDDLGIANGGAADGAGQNKEIADTTFSHVDQFAVIIRCANEAEQEERFNKLRDEYGADQVKVVVV